MNPELDPDPHPHPGTGLDPDPCSRKPDSSAGNPANDEPVHSPDQHLQDPEVDLVMVWAPSGRRLVSGLLGLNLVLLGAALVAGQASNREGLKHQVLQVYLLLLMGVSLVWMLWYLLWARKLRPHRDHHAGGVAVTLVLLIFAAVSLLLLACRTGYLLSTSGCQPAATLTSSIIEMPFLFMQTYLLWAHSKDCIHRQKILTRSGLIVILSADLLLWFHAVTHDAVHQQIAAEREDGLQIGSSNASVANDSDSAGSDGSCSCHAGATCLTFRKAFEILYPFGMEYYLMAGCMVYVMWKNVGRRMSPAHHHDAQKLTFGAIHHRGVMFGLVLGGAVLVAGVTVFVLYQVWVVQRQRRLTAFHVFYGYHLAVMPVMSLSSLAGLLVHRLERRAQQGGRNPTRSLDVALLLAAALGQLALSYFSLVAALAVGTRGPIGGLDLCYSLLSLLELLLQNMFIIEGLHRHPHQLAAGTETGTRHRSVFKSKRAAAVGERKAGVSLLDSSAAAPPAAGREHDAVKPRPWAKRVIQEICAFLILSNIMLWVIPAFGVHPQFENGLGKQFFGFTAWFVLVNLGQPLSVFYRMHSVGALMELLVSA